MAKKQPVQKNDELQRSEDRYNRMISEVQDYAILLLSKEGVIENWNQGAEKIKGYKAEEIIGKSFRIFYPEEDRGLNRLLPSIRLKNIRRGQQDAAIMWMAEKKAGRQKVITIISQVVPKALSEVDMKDAVPWSQKGDDYEKARKELLKLL